MNMLGVYLAVHRSALDFITTVNPGIALVVLLTSVATHLGGVEQEIVAPVDSLRPKLRVL